MIGSSIHGHMVLLDERKLDPLDEITKTLRPFRLHVINAVNLHA